MTERLLCRHPAHHLFGIQPDQQVVHYSTSPKFRRLADFKSANLSIWKLKKIFTLFSLYLDFWGSRPPKPQSRNELKLVWSVLERLSKGQSVPRADIQQTAIILLQLGPASLMQGMQKNLDAFSPALTPQFRLLLQKMDFKIDPASELIFHPCNPDIYVWTPGDNLPEKMIVVFLTRGNTLNMPRALAHILLSRLGVGLMYIGNRPNMKQGEFLVGHSLEEAASLISRIAQGLGVKQLFGLGASYGGYKACQLANRLNFTRVLNFSGAISDQNVDESSTKDMAPGYDLSKILTILSNSDATDIKIRESYDRNGFFTPRSSVDSNSHGSFMAAFNEGRLDPYLAWLVHGVGSFSG
jgi:hypothetical protein